MFENAIANIFGEKVAFNNMDKKHYHFDPSIGIDGLPLGNATYNGTDLKRIYDNEEELTALAQKMPDSDIKYDYNAANIVIKDEPVLVKESLPRQDSENEEQIMVALTFNDAPTKYTKPLLEILYAYRVKATFFIYGLNIDTNLDLLRQMVSEGNEIGIHSYEDVLFKDLDGDEIKNQIIQMRQLLDIKGIKYSNLVRPPKGKMYRSTIEKLDAPIQMGDIDVTNLDTSVEIIREVTSNITDGSVVMFDGNKSETHRALIKLIPYLEKKGYKLVTVRELYANRKIVQEPNKVYANIRPMVNYLNAA